MSEALEPVDLAPPDFTIVGREVSHGILSTAVVIDGELKVFEIGMLAHQAGRRLKTKVEDETNGDQ